jgi:hypothetical protein
VDGPRTCSIGRLPKSLTEGFGPAKVTIGTWTVETFLIALLLIAAAPLKRLWRGDWRPWEQTGPSWPAGNPPQRRWVRTWPVAYFALLSGTLVLPGAQLSTTLGVILAASTLLAILLGIAIFCVGRPQKLVPPTLR